MLKNKSPETQTNTVDEIGPNNNQSHFFRKLINRVPENWMEWVNHTRIDVYVMIAVTLSLGIFWQFLETYFGIVSDNDYQIFYDQINDYTMGYYYFPHFNLYFFCYKEMLTYEASENIQFFLIAAADVGLILLIRRKYGDLKVRWSYYLILLLTNHYEFAHLNFNYIFAFYAFIAYELIDTKYELFGAVLMAYMLWKVNFAVLLIPLVLKTKKKFIYCYTFVSAFILFNLYFIINHPMLYEALLEKFLGGGNMFSGDPAYLMFRNLMLRDYHLPYLVLGLWFTWEELAQKNAKLEEIKKYQWLTGPFCFLWFWILSYIFVDLL